MRKGGGDFHFHKGVQFLNIFHMFFVSSPRCWSVMHAIQLSGKLESLAFPPGGRSGHLFLCKKYQETSQKRMWETNNSVNESKSTFQNKNLRCIKRNEDSAE